MKNCWLLRDPFHSTKISHGFAGHVSQSFVTAAAGGGKSWGIFRFQRNPPRSQRKMFVFFSRWWQLKYVLFSPLPGEMIQFDEHIFQMGWNHQLVLVFTPQIDGLNTIVSFWGPAYFQGRTVSFREGRFTVRFFQITEKTNLKSKTEVLNQIWVIFHHLFIWCLIILNMSPSDTPSFCMDSYYDHHTTWRIIPGLVSG